MILGGGQLESTRILKEESIRLMTSVQSPNALLDKGDWAGTLIAPTAVRVATYSLSDLLDTQASLGRHFG